MPSSSSSSSFVTTAAEGPVAIDDDFNLPLPTTLPPDKDHRRDARGRTIVVGIEGSANKVGVGVLRYDPSDRAYTILSNPRKTYVPPTGHGFLPKETSWHHQHHVVALVRSAMREAFGDEEEEVVVSAVAYTKGPGMGGPLRSCAVAARTLSLLWDCPLVAVNHCVAHVEMGRVATSVVDPVVLYVSGGNTQVLAFSDRRYRVFGETIDVAVGNCLDRIARAVGLSNDPSPGYNVERKARERVPSNNNDKDDMIDLPYVVKGMDVSLSGTLAKAEALAKTQRYSAADLCFAVQETIFAALVEITERAVAHTGRDRVLVVGGVGCNRRLQEMMADMLRARARAVGESGDGDGDGDRAERGLCAMDHRYCVDNGAMIAQAGIFSLQFGEITPMAEATCTQRFRTDSVEAVWRRPNRSRHG